MPTQDNQKAHRIRAVQIEVTPVNGGWRLLVDQQPIGRFSARLDAVLCAGQIARQTTALGGDAEVVAHETADYSSLLTEVAA